MARVILLPIGHDDSAVRRQPWVTYTLMAVCLVALLATNGRVDEAEAQAVAAQQRLVAAVGEAMLERLPQLEGGCLNYWEAGNWALHDDAPPQGSKRAAEHRSVHLHVFGRSRHARSADWRWGEAPRFPSFADRIAWARRHERLRSSECAEIVARTDALLLEKYAMKDREKWGACESCGYPAPASAHDCS